jgi:hypothetical protein
VKDALKGLDQQVPGSGFFRDALKQAVESGEIPMARRDKDSRSQMSQVVFFRTCF